MVGPVEQSAAADERTRHLAELLERRDRLLAEVRQVLSEIREYELDPDSPEFTEALVEHFHSAKRKAVERDGAT